MAALLRCGRRALLVLTAITATSAAVAADDRVPWPGGQPPDSRTLADDVLAAVDVGALETAEDLLEASEKGEDSEHIFVRQEAIDRGELSKQQLFRFGDALFSHEFRADDGMGSTSSVVPLSRVHGGVRGGLDTFSCAGCHSVGGPNGAGAFTQNAMLDGDGDRASSAIVRNAPAVLGLGFVQALGAEMTTALQRQRAAAVAEAIATRRAVSARLAVKGVHFGVLRVEPSGAVDASAVEGVAPDLVVRPFGWKGTVSQLRRLVEDAARVHFGIQSTVLCEHHRTSPQPALLGHGPNWFDPDGDGKQRELEEGTLTATVVYFAMLESPVILPPSDAGLRDRWAAGSAVFDAVGCGTCHTRELGLEDHVLREMPDTTKGPGFAIDLFADGMKPKSSALVKLFSDLKRHDMGASLADPHDNADGVPRSVFLTRPLWGLAETAPYLHDGRATTIPEAILAHGGEAQASRDAFAAAPADDRMNLHVFLLSLTRAQTPRVAR